MARPFPAKTGDRFGSLTLIDIRPFVKGVYSRRCLCRCDCGNEYETSWECLRIGSTRSCGCLRGVKRRKHGGAGTPTYNSWNAMRTRCLCETAFGYEYYGGRGITICARWDDYATFLADMGERPEGTSLDRIDPDGNYEPSNCRWADRVTQANNQRRNRTDSGVSA